MLQVLWVASAPRPPPCLCSPQASGIPFCPPRLITQYHHPHLPFGVTQTPCAAMSFYTALILVMCGSVARAHTLRPHSGSISRDNHCSFILKGPSLSPLPRKPSSSLSRAESPQSWSLQIGTLRRGKRNTSTNHIRQLANKGVRSPIQSLMLRSHASASSSVTSPFPKLCSVEHLGDISGASQKQKETKDSTLKFFFFFISACSTWYSKVVSHPKNISW